MPFPACSVSVRQRLPVLLCILCCIAFAIGTSVPAAQPEYAPQESELFLLRRPEQKPLPANAKASVFPEFLLSLDVLQQEFYAIWQGVWPTSIDWTSAVLGTHFSAALSTLSGSYSSLESEKETENLINKYFSQLVGAYFGQDVFGIMQEAHDDMLWVVLEWLESIKFIKTHSELHYSDHSSSEEKRWYGTQYIPAFAHRARIFWDLASRGWDTTLCRGGMLWSPYPPPYKNAITNELYLTASISMYLYFPGDNNSSPFDYHTPGFEDNGSPGKPHDAKYLREAIEAYTWLKYIHMTNDHGLYVDGYHISGWSDRNNTGTVCDKRDEMVYTYNQGVLLSGLRGLYEATGLRDYLSDGHQLVRDVIRATGWHSGRSAASDIENKSPVGRWHGLGRSGILEDACDSSGTCSQDGQNFKGIFFHHLALFCARLPPYITHPNGYSPAKEIDMQWHDASCAGYRAWIQHNAEAALATKDRDGKLGMWWGAPRGADVENFHAEVELPEGVVDHHNPGVQRQSEKTRTNWNNKKDRSRDIKQDTGRVHLPDLNDRGRGRTVETHGGGVAVLRAAWETSPRKWATRYQYS